MSVRDFAEVICGQKYENANMPITVVTHNKHKKILWQGPAKDLKNQTNIAQFLVMEMTVDRTVQNCMHIPDYDRGKILSVM